MTATASGAQFEIKVDGVVRWHRDFRETAIEAARYFQQRIPGAKIVITDLRDGLAMALRFRRTIDLSPHMFNFRRTSPARAEAPTDTEGVYGSRTITGKTPVR